MKGVGMANKKKRTASISDVAKAAGVSTATISRVFNNRDSVHPETRSHVLAVAKEIGFQLSDRRPGPKPPANELRSVIRFIQFLDIHTEVAPEMNKTLVLIKRGVEAATEESGFRSVYNIYDSEDNLTFAPEDGETAGVVLLGCRPKKKTEEMLRKYPCCWVMTGLWSPAWGDQVMPDHREAGRLAARYLADRGHRNIALLRFGRRNRVHRFRVEGFEYEMRAFPEIEWSIIENEMEQEGFKSQNEQVQKLVDQLTNLSPQPTGLFVDQDRTLLMLYPELEKSGLIPGENIEIISCNNIGVYRKQLPFEYKSIDVHFELIGRLSIGQLLWRMKNPGVTSQVRSLMLPALPQCE